MGLGITHFSPLWAQSERQLVRAYEWMQIIDSVWDLTLHVGDRAEFEKDKRMNQFSFEMMMAGGIFGNPCAGYRGTFEHFSTTLALLVQGYPFFFARNKDLEEGEIISSRKIMALRADIEAVQLWVWLDWGNVCCKIQVTDEDDWFGGLFWNIYSGFSEYDWETLLTGEGAYSPEKKYPVATWDQFDFSQIEMAAARAAAGE